MIGTNEENPDFIGLGKFIWWFGVVEDRFDPLNLGRCKVRCFGWHTERKSDIATDDLPWAHPVVPYGIKSVQPPAEGTMVFGFFADGAEGRYPILMGVIPGVPDDRRNSFTGFSDPYTFTQKNVSTDPVFPRRVADSKVTINAAGPQIVNDTVKRQPERLNEPTVSRLSRPDRIESANTGSSLGVRSASIKGTAIDFQRKNRLVNIRSSRFKQIGKKRTHPVWNEPFPSYNAKYPFNNATETESGHAFEMDDTPNYERVQLSHRTGSTLEFLPSGSIKEKSFKNKYDIVMGNHKVYVNGAKEETVQGGMFLKIDGELVIQCNGFRLESVGDVNIKGRKVNITADSDLSIVGKSRTSVYGAGTMDLRSDGLFRAYGGYSAALHSGGVTSVNATPVSAAIAPALKAFLEKAGIKLGAPPTSLNSGVVIGGPNLWVETLLFTNNAAVTNILPSASASPKWPDSAKAAKGYNPPNFKVKPTKPAFNKEPTDSMAFLEKNRVKIDT